MTKIIQSRIIASAKAPLTKTDRITLQRKKSSNLKLLATGYIPLLLILLYLFLNGAGVIQRDKGMNSVEFNDEDIERFHVVQPWVMGFFFVMLHLFFAVAYFRSVAPLVRDLRFGEKSLLSFKAEKNEMSGFDKYYVTTPIRESQLIRISREDFFRIDDAGELVLAIGPRSCQVLGISQGEHRIEIVEGF